MKKQRRGVFYEGQSADAVRLVAKLSGRRFTREPEVNPDAMDEEGQVDSQKVRQVTYHFIDVRVVLRPSKDRSQRQWVVAEILPPAGEEGSGG